MTAMTGGQRDIETRQEKLQEKYSFLLAAWRYGLSRGQADYGNTWAAPGPAHNRVMGRAIMKIYLSTPSPLSTGTAEVQMWKADFSSN